MIIATIASVVLSFIPLDQACGNGTLSDSCLIVQTSEYETTFGMKNAHMGLIAFPILAILTILEIKRPRKYQKKVITTGMILGSLFALYFLYIQFFVLNAICKYCLVTDIAILLSLGLIISWDKNLFYPKRKE